MSWNGSNSIVQPMWSGNAVDLVCRGWGTNCTAGLRLCIFGRYNAR